MLSPAQPQGEAQFLLVHLHGLSETLYEAIEVMRLDGSGCTSFLSYVPFTCLQAKDHLISAQRWLPCTIDACRNLRLC